MIEANSRGVRAATCIPISANSFSTSDEVTIYEVTILLISTFKRPVRRCDATQWRSGTAFWSPTECPKEIVDRVGISGMSTPGEDCTDLAVENAHHDFASVTCS